MQTCFVSWLVRVRTHLHVASKLLTAIVLVTRMSRSLQVRCRFLTLIADETEKWGKVITLVVIKHS